MPRLNEQVEIAAEERVESLSDTEYRYFSTLEVIIVEEIWRWKLYTQHFETTLGNDTDAAFQNLINHTGIVVQFEEQTNSERADNVVARCL